MGGEIHVPPVPDNVKRLLVVRQSALGDIVNALYSLRAIREAYPSAHVTWVVDDRFRELFDAVEGVDEVVVFPRRRWGRWAARPWRWPQLLAEWIRYKRRLGDMHFDVAVDLQGSLKSRLTLKAVRADEVFRYSRGPSPGLNDLSSVDRIPLEPDDPASDLRATQFMAHLQRAGVRPSPGPFPWKLPEDAVRVVEDHLGREGLARGSFAVLHPGSSAFGAYKRWPAERFAELAKRLSLAGTPVVVAWGPGERGLAEGIVASAGQGGAGVRLAPETQPLPVLVALLQRAGVVVGNDSGPLHVASACGTPTVGLYGPKDPSVYAPYSPPRAVLYHPLPCSPCGRRRCSNPECMKALSVDAVFEKARALLENRIDSPFKGQPLRGPADRLLGRISIEASPPVPGPYRQFTAGAWLWTVAAGEEGTLADAAMRSTCGLPGTPWRGNPRRTFLRQRLPRFNGGAASSGPADGRDVFIKVYPVDGLVHRLRALIGHSQAEVEFGRLVQLRAAGAPVPAPVALGDGPGAQALVMEDFGPVQTVREAIEGGLGAGEKRELMAALADAVADLHAAGFIHEDLHVGNVLRLAGGALRVIDVQRGRRVPVPSLRDRALTLAHVFQSLLVFTRVTERHRLLCRYAGRLEMDTAGRRVLNELVKSELLRLRRRYVSRQMQRARQGGSRFWIGDWNGGRARAAFGAESWLNEPEAVEAVVKDEAGRRVLKVRKAGHTLAVKEEGRRGRGIRAWIGAHGWLAAGYPTPRPFYLVEPPAGPVRLAMEWAEGAESSNGWLERRLGAGAPPAWRREAAWRLGRFVRRLHDAGIYHADLKAGNVLARERDGGPPDFLVLDLDRVCFHAGPVPRTRSLANLAQLNAAFAGPVTRADRLRCFFAYAARDRGLRRGWKDAVREVMRRTIARRHRWP
jgi:ADP-heptose:LPS heptosyltransferase/tRNA A-37 threonylcarbamoyl transferase component Bud32